VLLTLLLLLCTRSEANNNSTNGASRVGNVPVIVMNTLNSDRARF